MDNDLAWETVRSVSLGVLVASMFPQFPWIGAAAVVIVAASVRDAHRLWLWRRMKQDEVDRMANTNRKPTS